MKRGTLITLIFIGLLAIGFVGYRTFQARTAHDRETLRLAAEQAEGERKSAEAKKRAEDEAEAHRLAALKAQRDGEESALELARLRSEEASAAARSRAAEDEAKAASDARERATREKEQTEGDARRLAEQRERDALQAEAARKAALGKLADSEREAHARADREAARLAALKRQQELEADLEQKAEMMARSIYPADYKRREHYYMDVDLKNSGAAQKPANPPARPAETPPPESGGASKP